MNRPKWLREIEERQKAEMGSAVFRMLFFLIMIVLSVLLLATSRGREILSIIAYAFCGMVAIVSLGFLVLMMSDWINVLRSKKDKDCP